jgi:hypothetical protein
MPRLVRSIGLGLLLGLAASPACHGCHDDDGPCRGDSCLCEDFDRCGFECEVDGCFGECRRLDVCDAACLDDCTLECSDVSQCSLGCADACTVECARVSRCDVLCDEDCDVECSDASTCHVELRSGRVTCARVGSCEVACVVGDATEPAIDCGGGVFVCGGC